MSKFIYLGKVEGEDVLQANTLPSAQSKRGHQGPAAFLILAAGLDKVISINIFTGIRTVLIFALLLLVKVVLSNMDETSNLPL